jgi:hypothetical protein
MNKGMDEEYFEEIKRRQMYLPQVSIINVAPEIFYNVVRVYPNQTIEGIINMINYMESKESALQNPYKIIRNIALNEMQNRKHFQVFNSEDYKISLN